MSGFAQSVRLPSYTLLNAGVYYETGRFKVGLQGKNLTNERYFRSNFPDLFGDSVVLPELPRNYFLSAGFKFWMTQKRRKDRRSRGRCRTGCGGGSLRACRAVPSDHRAGGREADRSEGRGRTMFEIGADTGDAAGEFQLWRERQKLDTRLPFAHHHDLYLNPSTGVLGMVTGHGHGELGERHDGAGDGSALRSVPRVLARGRASPGVDPHRCLDRLGGVGEVPGRRRSARTRSISREMPADWPTGYFARCTRKPYDPKKPDARRRSVPPESAPSRAGRSTCTHGCEARRTRRR